MFSFFLIVAGRNLPSLSSLDVNYDVQPVQPTILPPPPPNVNYDAPPVQTTLPLPPPNVIFVNCPKYLEDKKKGVAPTTSGTKGE
ncbi:hypothetical protein P8452_49998 [Trifolium repens]|nr:hypothetical protein P8452_49998 [Trifolium repens]